MAPSSDDKGKRQGEKVPSVKKDGEIIPRAGTLWLIGS
jgi:hypothetical protein